jgi:F-type H+-transporting ATPase subunit gamma
MMSSLESIRKKVEGTEDLGGVVKTMKTLAAVSIRQYERAVESLADYNRTIEMGLQVALQAGAGGLAAPATRNRDGGLGAVILGSDQGLVGRFNEHIASHAISAMDELHPAPGRRLVACVGERAYQHLEDAQQPVEELLSLPSSLTGITPTVQTLLVMIDGWRAQGGIDRIALFYNRTTSSTSYSPHTVHLLPLDQEWLRSLLQREWPTNVLPTFTMDGDQLFSHLIRNYIFVSLYRAFAESLASENASRLASMQQAERNIAELLDELKAQYRHQRQTSITEELLDTMSGFQALVEGGG